MKVQINLDKLSQSGINADVRRVVINSVGGATTGVHAVDISSLRISSAEKFELSKWSLLQSATTASELPEQIDVAALEADQKSDIKRRADRAAAVNRLQQYVVEQGLEETTENAERVKEWLQQNLKGYWSSLGVDACLQNLGPKGKNTLTWKKTTVAPPPPPPAEPAEILVTLPNGELQLALNTPDWQLKQASVVQLKDLNARRRVAATGTYRRPPGVFGSSIF
jgi:hypothetical protein